MSATLKPKFLENQPEPEQEPQAPTLEELCLQWRKAKASEEAANGRRVEIERQIIAATGFAKTEGSQTFKTDGFKVELKAGRTYKLDASEYAKIEGKLPEDMRPVKTKLVLDETGFKWMAKNAPADVFALVQPCVTVAPAKVGVTVSVL